MISLVKKKKKMLVRHRDVFAGDNIGISKQRKKLFRGGDEGKKTGRQKEKTRL